MNTITIDTRRARASDSFAISGVHETSWRHAYNGIIPHRSLDTMVRRRDPKWWARAIRNSTRILVLEVGSQIVGYATVGPNRVSELPQDGEVYELYLLPEYQGIGLGKQLFLAARGELAALGMTTSLVWVLEDNMQATHFYANAGGRDVAEGSETFNGTTLSKVAYAWN